MPKIAYNHSSTRRFRIVRGNTPNIMDTKTTTDIADIATNIRRHVVDFTADANTTGSNSDVPMNELIENKTNDLKEDCAKINANNATAAPMVLTNVRADECCWISLFISAELHSVPIANNWLSAVDIAAANTPTIKRA